MSTPASLTVGVAAAPKLSIERRRELHRANLEASKRYPSEDELSKLDSSLKKNSAFVKRLKSITSENVESILRELSTLKLTKYVTEAAVALSECRLKTAADTAAVVEVACAIHQCYQDFRKRYLESLEKETIASLASVPLEEVSSWLIRQRQLLKLLAELNLVGLVENPSAVFLMLTKLMPEDNVTGPLHLPLVTSFIKGVGPFYVKRDVLEGSYDDLVTMEWRTKFTTAVHSYFKSMCRFLVRSHAKLQSLEARSRYHYETRGDLSAGNAADLQATVETVEKLKINLQVLGDILNLTLPALTAVEAPKVLEGKIVFADPTLAKGEGKTSVIFDSEEDRSFYEDILDLADRVPSTFLYGIKSNLSSGTVSPSPVDSGEGEGTTSKDRGAEQEEDDEGGERGEEEEIDLNQIAYIDPETVAGKPIDETISGENLKSAAGIKSFFEKLPTMQSRALADQAAIDFCYINSKDIRRRLAETLIGLPVRRLDLLPFIGRLLATLKPYFPSVVAEVNQSLLGQFVFLFHRKEPILGTRSRICRFIGELTKFRVMSQASTYSMLKKCISEDLTTYNIDMTCIILESCGRFLFNQPESHRRLINLFEICGRKRGIGMDITHVVMLDNAMYISNPPQVVLQKKAPKPPRLAYILRLVRWDLTPSNAPEIFRKICKFPWNDSQCQAELMRVFLKAWKVKYSSVPLLASMLGTLRVFYPAFVVDLVDRLLEEINDCLTVNLAKNNQKILTCVKFIGELFSFEVLEADMVFHTLHLLVTFGHGGVPRAIAPCLIDGPEDSFRIRLICILLQTCGTFIYHSEQMEGFLLLFEYYVSTKKSVPIDIDYLLDDTYDQLGRKPFSRELGTAIARLNDFNGGRFEFLLEDLHTNLKDLNYEGTDLAMAEEQESRTRTTVKQAEEFDKALSGMLTSGIEERKLERKVSTFDAPIPFALLSPTHATHSSPREIRMLVKKKNKAITRVLPIDPSSLAFVAQTLAGREAEAEEAKTVQRLVLESQREGRVERSSSLADGRRDRAGKITFTLYGRRD